MIFNSLSITLGVMAGLVQIFGYLLYIKKINIGRVKPNTASWSIWAFGAVLESSSYIFVTGDWVKNLLPIACAVSAILIFLYCLRNGHFVKPTRFEWSLVFLDCMAIFIWWWYSSAVYANLFLVFIAVVSFIPIIVHAWRDPMVEDATPWFIWTFAYTLLAIVVVVRWEKWEDLVYPLVFIVLHVIVAILALDRRVAGKLKFSNSK